jgi:hypothetical protein
MANSYDATTVFTRLMDAVYQVQSLTARMDAPTAPAPQFDGTAIVKVMKLSTVGLGNYNRTTGYPSGDVTAAWETLTLAIDRARSFSVDRADNEEQFGMLVGALVNALMTEQVAPEFDAYRFAKFAGWTGIQAATPATLAKNTVLDALDAAKKALNTKKVPASGRLLYVSDEVMSYLEGSVTRVLTTENGVDRRVTSFDGMPVIMVPQDRFYTKIDLVAGTNSNEGGFIKNVATGKDINFMMLHPSAVLQAKKLDITKYFPPEVNQITDGHLWQYRLYHDAFLYDNKKEGVYLHNKA